MAAAEVESPKYFTPSQIFVPKGINIYPKSPSNW
jgi:hypothetical protein